MAKKIVTGKQELILLLLYIFRFLNSRQIQEFLGHKDHRRINSWLKDLTEKEYVVRDFKPIFGTLTKPATYYLTALGRGYIQHGYQYYFPKYLRRIARDNKASKSFRIRCQIVADWYLTIFPIETKKLIDSENTKNKKIGIKTGIAIVDYIKTLLLENVLNEEKIPMNKAQFFTPSYFPDFILLDKIKPDAYARKGTTKGITHGFLFVLDAYIPRLMLRYLAQRLFTVLDEEYWEEDSIHHLEFYILCPNNMIIIYLRRLLPSFLQKYYGGKPVQFNFATRNQLYQKRDKGKDIKWITISSED